jgi:hypothetical protein
MAYVVKIINVNNAVRQDAQQIQQGDKLSQSPLPTSTSEKLNNIQNGNLGDAVEKAGTLKEAMENVTNKIQTGYKKFSEGGIIGQKYGAGAAAGVSIAVAALDIGNQLSSNIGNFTRNKTTQNKINNIKSVISQSAGAAGKVTAGAAAGGPIGAIAAIASIGLDYSIKAYNLALEIEERTANANRSSERLGRIVSLRGRA